MKSTHPAFYIVVVVTVAAIVGASYWMASKVADNAAEGAREKLVEDYNKQTDTINAQTLAIEAIQSGEIADEAITLSKLSNDVIKILRQQRKASTSTTTTSTSTSTSGVTSISGDAVIEVVDNGDGTYQISLDTACSDEQVLKWNLAESKWECAANATGSTGLWEIGSKGVFQEDLAVIVGSNAAFQYVGGGVGDLKVADDFEALDDGYFGGNLVVGASTSSTETITNPGFSLGGDDLFVAGMAGVEGNIYTDGAFVAGVSLTVHGDYIRDTGNLVLQADNDSDDYIYIDTTGDQEHIYFEDSSLVYANDPGFRLNSTTGELEYRDENEAVWTALDDGGGGGGSWHTSGDDIYYNDGNVSVGTSTTDFLFTVSGSGTGVDQNTIVLENTADITDNDRANFRISTGGASAGDPFFQFVVDTETDWSPGIDNSDADRFKISANYYLQSDNIMTLETGGDVGIGTEDPGFLLHVSGSDEDIGNNTAMVENTGTGSANEHAELRLQTADAGGGDPFIRFSIDGVVDWSAGLDNGSSDVFVIGSGYGPGQDDILFLNDSGYFGIGAAPDYLVDIMGSGGGAHINFEDSSAANDIRLSFKNGGDGAGDELIHMTTNADWVFGIDNNDSDKFKISPHWTLENSTAMTITTGGIVGIGDTSPATGSLVVADGVAVGTDDTDHLIDDSSSGASTATLYIGNETITTAASDRRLKENIEDSEINALGLIDQMRVKDYDWKSGERRERGRSTGMIAQEVYDYLPQVVKRPDNPENTWAIEYSFMVPYTVKAIQEQQDQIEDLKLDTNGLLAEDYVTEKELSRFARIKNKLVTFTKAVAFKSKATFEKSVAFLADVTFKGRVKFEDKDMAGVAVIEKDQSETRVDFEKPYESKPVITATPEGQAVNFAIKDVSSEGFTIILEDGAGQDIPFNWTALQIGD